MMCIIVALLAVVTLQVDAHVVRVNLFFQRHAYSCANVLKAHGGTSGRMMKNDMPDPTLSEFGKLSCIFAHQQAILPMKHAGVIFDSVLSSTMIRAQLTARLTFGQQVHPLPYIAEKGSTKDNTPLSMEDQQGIRKKYGYEKKKKKTTDFVDLPIAVDEYKNVRGSRSDASEKKFLEFFRKKFLPYFFSNMVLEDGPLLEKEFEIKGMKKLEEIKERRLKIKKTTIETKAMNEIKKQIAEGKIKKSSSLSQQLPQELRKQLEGAINIAITTHSHFMKSMQLLQRCRAYFTADRKPRNTQIVMVPFQITFQRFTELTTYSPSWEPRLDGQGLTQCVPIFYGVPVPEHSHTLDIGSHCIEETLNAKKSIVNRFSRTKVAKSVQKHDGHSQDFKNLLNDVGELNSDWKAYKI